MQKTGVGAMAVAVAAFMEIGGDAKVGVHIIEVAAARDDAAGEERVLDLYDPHAGRGDDHLGGVKPDGVDRASLFAGVVDADAEVGHCRAASGVEEGAEKVRWIGNSRFFGRIRSWKGLGDNVFHASREPVAETVVVEAADVENITAVHPG